MLAAPVLDDPAADIHAQIADVKGRPRSFDPAQQVKDRLELAKLARTCAVTGCHDCHRDLRRLHECPCDRCRDYHRIEAWLQPDETGPRLPNDLHPAGGTAGLTVVPGSALGGVPAASAPDRRMDAVAEELDLWLACTHLKDIRPHGQMLYTAALFARRTPRCRGWYASLAAEMWRRHPTWWGLWLEEHRINVCDSLLEAVVLGMAERLEGWR